MSYISPKVEVRQSPVDGIGLFSLASIAKNELIIDYAQTPGQLCSGIQADQMAQAGYRRIMQVGDDLFFVAAKSAENLPLYKKNHSCDPNCGIRGSWQVVAMRDIEPGEEITTDYAMNESSEDYSMECHCGSPDCRGMIRGEDWKNILLQKKYQGYFSEYLKRRIGKSEISNK